MPETVESIVVLGNAPRMAVYLGLGDMVAGYSGMSSGDISRSRPTPMSRGTPGRIRASWGRIPRETPPTTARRLILTGADVIFCTATADVADRLQRETGIPCLALEQGTLFGEDFERSLRIMAGACGVTERAEEISAYVDECFAELESLTADVPEAERPSVLSAAATFPGPARDRGDTG